MPIRKTSTINEIIHQYPESVKFFVDQDMNCSTCFAVNFDTLENGALMHGMDVNALVQKLQRYIQTEHTPITPLKSKV